MGLLLTPILMNALAVHIALRMKIWNIGSEGQFFMGAWAAAGVGIHWDGPRYVVLGVMALAAVRRRGGLDPRPGAGPGPLAGQRDHHHAAVELRRRPVGGLVQLRHLARPGGCRRPVDPGRARPVAVPPRLEHPVHRHLRAADHRRRDVRRLPVDALGLRGRHDRRQPPGGGVRRHPRDAPHRRRHADLGCHRRAVGDAPPGRSRPAAQRLDLQQLRTLRLHRRGPRRELRGRRRRRLDLHRRAPPRRDHAAVRRAVGVRHRRRVRPRAARHRRRRGRRPLPRRARRQRSNRRRVG